MLFWFGQLKYFLPPEMSGPLIHAALFQSKKLVEAIGLTVKKNVLRRNVPVTKTILASSIMSRLMSSMEKVPFAPTQ